MCNSELIYIRFDMKSNIFVFRLVHGEFSITFALYLISVSKVSSVLVHF